MCIRRSAELREELRCEVSKDYMYLLCWERFCEKEQLLLEVFVWSENRKAPVHVCFKRARSRFSDSRIATKTSQVHLFVASPKFTTATRQKETM